MYVYFKCGALSFVPVVYIVGLRAWVREEEYDGEPHQLVSKVQRIACVLCRLAFHFN